ncbi:universal stress protein [Halopenitus sp. H-Gu1]|uniref:universal stress protein n=1 Tax=Halopenitus sp. H-Gu1 TaxID=3242697 RepID=UPI00359EC952
MTILAAIGGEHERDEVVEVGHELAEAYDEELVALHVMEQDQFEELRESSDVTTPVVVPGGSQEAGFRYAMSEESLSDYDLEDATDDAAGVAERCVERTLSEEQRADIAVKGRVGDPETEIIEEADRIDARYIVVGGRKRSPIGKAIFGSISQSIMINSDRPVVALTRNE